MTIERATATGTIWKFPLPPMGDYLVLEMPRGAEILLFAVQDLVPTLWARVEPDAPLEERQFRFAGTGHPIEWDVGDHVGSCFQGPFVWHLFEYPLRES